MSILSYLTKKERFQIVAASLYFSIDILLGTGILIMMIDMLTMIAGGNGYFDNLYLYWLAIGGVLVIKALMNCQADLKKHKAGFDITERIRISMIHKLKKFSLGFYTKERLGEVSTIIHKDVDTLESVAAHLWSRMLGDMIVTLIIGIYLAFTNLTMFIGMIALLPIGIFILVKGIQKNIQMEKANKSAQMDMVSLFVEFAKGIPLLKAFQESKDFENRLMESTKAFGSTSKKISTHIAAYIGKYLLCLEMSYAIMLMVGIYGLINGSVTLTEFLIFSMVSKEFYKPFASLESHFINYVRAEESYLRIKKILVLR